MTETLGVTRPSGNDDPGVREAGTRWSETCTTQGVVGSLGSLIASGLGAFIYVLSMSWW